MEFHGTSKKFYRIPLYSMKLFSGKLEVTWNFMELGIMGKLNWYPWNFGSRQNFMEFHGIWGYVAEVEWNSMELQMLLKCWKSSTIFWYVMSNSGISWGITQTLKLKHRRVKQTYKIYRVIIMVGKLIHPAKLIIIAIKAGQLKIVWNATQIKDSQFRWQQWFH